MEIKLLLGRLLGETYRLQNRLGVEHGLSDWQIYGVLRGFESEINDQIGAADLISDDAERSVIDVLSEYDSAGHTIGGFYELEDRLRRDGHEISGLQIKAVLKRCYVHGGFIDQIDSMDSAQSPAECRSFDLRHDEKLPPALDDAI